MGWLATLHGDLSHLHPDEAKQAEQKVSDALQAVAGGLVDAGHQGVGATFHGDKVGDVNLLEPGATPDIGPHNPEPGETVETPRYGEVPADATETPESGETGQDVELPPGTAKEPTPSAEGIDAETGQETAPEGPQG
jgi:hypothetical protein